MAGFSSYFTNHSLHATVVTRLFEENVDEQLIMAKTSHVSTGLHRCMHTSASTNSSCSLQHVSNAVACKKPASSTDATVPPATASSSSSTMSSASSCPDNSVIPFDKSGQIIIHGAWIMFSTFT